MPRDANIDHRSLRPKLLAMPKLDRIHNAVKTALTKDNWLITDDPYIIQYGKTTLYADLAAERPIAAERDGQKLVIEVKSFIGASKIQDLKEALGQYDIYRYLLEEIAPDRKLYVAISAVAYKNFFCQDVIQLILKKHQLPLIIVNIETEEIQQWIN
ncbi:element excision factor XisH family protein [Alkalinema pantanalense CENA528]|uniref:element excision factor XisH family protein n=1 Tax=Alkalinema pantanalense TaxID=1620705 RepID=UPI003D6FBE63